jgi:hypothetical protein
MDVSCHVVLGTPITKDLLFVTKQRWNHKECCKDDANAGKRFCSHCGTEFKNVSFDVPTKEFIKLLEEEGFDIEERISVGDLCLYDLEMIHNVQSVQGSEENWDDLVWDDLVLGVVIGNTRSYIWGESYPQPTSWNRIEEAIAKIKRMANTMNLTNAPINLYSVLHVSV